MSKSITDKIPDKIKEARKLAGLTQEILADRIGVVRTTVAAYESGRYPVSLETLAAIAKACERPVSWFLDEDVEPPTALDAMKIVQRRLEDAAIEELHLIQYQANWRDSEDHLDKVAANLNKLLTPHGVTTMKSLNAWLSKLIDYLESGDGPWEDVSDFVKDNMTSFAWAFNFHDEIVGFLKDFEKSLVEKRQQRLEPVRPPVEDRQPVSPQGDVEVDPVALECWEAWKERIGQPELRLTIRKRNYLRKLIFDHGQSDVMRGIRFWSEEWLKYNENDEIDPGSIPVVWQALHEIIETRGMGYDRPPDYSDNNGGFPPTDDLGIEDIPF